MATTSASVSVTAESLRESSRITTSEMVQNTSSTKVTSGQMPSTLTPLTTSSENSPMTAAGFTMTGEVREETTPNGTAYVTCCQACINCTASQSENDQHKTSIPIISGVVIGCLSLLALFTCLLIWKRKKVIFCVRSTHTHIQRMCLCLRVWMCFLRVYLYLCACWFVGEWMHGCMDERLRGRDSQWTA